MTEFSRISYRIIKRRIAWVVGRWLADESRQASTVLVWQLLLHLLRDNASDPVVRLSTAVALTQCLDVGILRYTRLYIPISIPDCHVRCGFICSVCWRFHHAADKISR